MSDLYHDDDVEVDSNPEDSDSESDTTENVSTSCYQVLCNWMIL